MKRIFSFQNLKFALKPNIPKIELLREANKAMYDAGLRHKFYIPDEE